MRQQDLSYYRAREQHCREMAALADDPDIRRRHYELANLHAGRAEFVARAENGPPGSA